MTVRRRIHLGIDYGTSNSKLVVRDFEGAGGDRAYVLLDEDSPRFSSSLAVTADTVLLGVRRSTRRRALQHARWFDSVKMRVASELKQAGSRLFYGVPTPLPEGLTAKDLAALTVWWLITEAYQGAASLVRLRGDQVLSPGMTMGVPMSFLTDPELRTEFADIARAGWELFRRGPKLTGREIALAAARRNVREALKVVQEDPLPLDETRLWIRSEAEAALWWAFRSPQVPEGPYVKVDVGAGTTNASVFRIVTGLPDGVASGQAVKLRMTFFGASSRATGMDAIDERLAAWRGIEATSLTHLRGHEDRLLAQSAARITCKGGLAGMHEALRDAWGQMRGLRPTALEVRAWLTESKLFVLGGGSLVEVVRTAMTEMPVNDGRRFPIIHLEAPPDLVSGGRRVTGELLPFVLVAYGLSVLAPPIPLVETPDTVSPMPETQPTLRQLDHADIYAR
jgi:hypothetical protein